MTVLLRGPWGLSAARRQALARAVGAALGRVTKRAGELCVILVSDREIRRINKKFLNHDYTTDVIAFGYPRTIRAAPPFGDIYIARGVARRQARELGHSVFEELLTLAVHGTLHLVGYDDHKPGDKRRMFARQERIVRRFLTCAP